MLTHAGDRCATYIEPFVGMAGVAAHVPPTLKRKLVPMLHDMEFRAADYRSLLPVPGDLIYCDPPYRNTTGYGATPAFDSAVFWSTVDTWCAWGAVVLVSEFTAPRHWFPVWSKKRAVSVSIGGGMRRTEGLYASWPFLR